MTIIALTKDNENLAGAIVYWRLTGDINGDDFNNALKDAGLDEHQIKLPTPRKALRRAMMEHSGGDVFLRAHKGATLLVRQHDGKHKSVEFDVAVEGRLSVAGTPTIKVFDEHGNEVESETAAAVTERYWHHVFHAATRDMSAWLIEQAGGCDALSMRDTGGVYWIPRHAIEDWQARVEVVHATTSCTIHQIPAMHSDDAVDAIMQALIDECTSFTEQLQADIESEDFGEQALRGRADKAKAMLDKLGRYESLLGIKLDEIREQIEEQKANAITAALVAGSDAA